MRLHSAGITCAIALTLAGIAPTMANEQASSGTRIVVDTDRTEMRERMRLLAARAEMLRSRFETIIDTYDRDIRADLEQAFEQLRDAGLASVDDVERLETALTGSESDWMSSDEFQAEFDRMKAQGLFAAHIEGRNNAGQSQYRAIFRARPTGLAGWECRHGMTQDSYEQREALLVEKGFRRVSLQSFSDATGSVRYQATWLRFRSGA